MEWTFYQTYKAIGGEAAVGTRHATGRKEVLQAERKEARRKEREKEKEL